MSAAALVASRLLDIARSLDDRGCYVYFDRILIKACVEIGVPLKLWVALNVTRIVPDNNLLGDAHAYAFGREIDAHVTLGYIQNNTPPDTLQGNVTDTRPGPCGQLLFGVHTHLLWKLDDRNARHDVQCLYLQDILTTTWHGNAECFVTLSTFAEELGNRSGRPYHASIRAK